MKKTIDVSENVRHRDPFKMPDNYIDGLIENIAVRIDIQAEHGKSRNVFHLWRWSAAACIAIMFGAGVLWQINTKTIYSDEEEMLLSEDMMDEEWNEVLDYAMINNDDITYYLTEVY